MRSTRPGRSADAAIMLSRVRRSLLIASAARDLAVDLVKCHGPGALAIVDHALAVVDRDRPDRATAAENERLLAASRDHIVRLVALLPDEARRSEPAVTLSSGSR